VVGKTGHGVEQVQGQQGLEAAADVCNVLADPGRKLPQDADLLENINPEWRKRYPGLQLTRDASLRRGDVMVRSRFGLIDSRQQTKLQALTHSLTGT